MAILYQSETGYFISHLKHSEEVYGTPYKKILFDIHTPFLMDLEAESVAQVLEGGCEKRKRKKKKFEQKELPLQESFVKLFLKEIHHLLKDPPTPSDFRLNNKPAREAVQNFLSSINTLQDTSLVEKLFNPLDKKAEVEILGERCIMPPLSLFYRNNISELHDLVDSCKKFSFIVIDPPWNNRFIKRKRKTGSSTSYNSLVNDSIRTMPIEQFCRDSTVVAIWCTNSSTHLNYLMNTLLPAWNLTHIATWFWIKVTTSGQFVCDWNGPSGKHPFERIIFARYGNPSDLEQIPDGKLIVSIPCAIHSFKPPLERLIRPYVHDFTCLELFARALQPDTVSWGDQVPLLQHVSLFEAKDEENNE